MEVVNAEAEVMKRYQEQTDLEVEWSVRLGPHHASMKAVSTWEERFGLFHRAVFEV